MLESVNERAATNEGASPDASGGSPTDPPAVVPFAEAMDAPVRRRLADLPGRVVEGDPHRASMTRHASEDGTLQAGTWTSTPGRWRVFGDRDEFCTLLSGRVALISVSGERQAFGPGESFLIPNGFEGAWEVSETAAKHFVIVHRESA